MHTLNLSAAEMRALKLPERYIELHGHFSRPLPNVTHLHGNSATFDLAGLPASAGPFDLIFIDGDHHYEAVLRDTARVFEHLVGPETVVVWHDASRQPGQPRWEVLAGLLDGLPPGLPGQLVQVGNTLCALYSPLPLPTQPADRPRSVYGRNPVAGASPRANVRVHHDRMRNFANPTGDFANPLRDFANPLRDFTDPMREFADPMRGFADPMRGFADPMRGFAE